MGDENRLGQYRRRPRAPAAWLVLLLLVEFGNFFLALIVGAWWLRHARTPAFPHAIVAVWFALLVAGPLSFRVAPIQYATAAVFLFGPGENSVNFQFKAVRNESPHLLDTLVFRGAKLDERLMCSAAQKSDPWAVEYLAQRGMTANVRCPHMDVYCVDRHRMTPLHTAVSGGRHRTAEALLKAGGSMQDWDCRGKTALDLATEREDQEMIQLLKHKGNKSASGS